MEFYLLLSLLLWLSNLCLYIYLIFDHTYLWQIKEYRFDRMSSSLKNELKLRSLFSILAIFKTVLLISSLLLFIHLNIYSLILACIDLALNIFLTSVIIQRFITKKFRRPKVSIRNLLILLSTLGLTILCLIYPVYLATNFPSPDLSIFLIGYFGIVNNTLLLLSFTFVSLVVLLTTPLAQYKRGKIISAAKQKLRKMPELKIIGITGSYGKTGTKEMLIKILSTKYKLGFTQENMNTEVGVALSVLENLPPDSEIFIYEAGAYKKGEIAKCTSIASPDIAIVTNVGKAHLDIFKSVENIALAKFELPNGLKPTGIAILNNDNFYTKEMAKKINNKSLFFHTDEDNEFVEPDNNRRILSIFDIDWNEPEVRFKVALEDTTISFQTKIVGRLQLRNLGAVLLTCLELGFTLKELSILLGDLIFESSHYKVYEGQSGVKIIDDGYNTNPEGFESAITHLKILDAKYKILITRGIPEMGKELKPVYFALKENIHSSVNVFITTDKNFFEIINQDKPAGFTAYYIPDNDKLTETIKKYLNQNSAVLIEGRINPGLHQFIKLYNK